MPSVISSRTVCRWSVSTPKRTTTIWSGRDGEGNARDCTNPSDPFSVTAFQRTRYPFCPATVTAFDASTSCEVIRPYDSPP